MNIAFSNTRNQPLTTGIEFKALIKRFEGLRLKPYNDLGYRVRKAKSGCFEAQEKGSLHIGYGHKFTDIELQSCQIELKDRIIDYSNGITKQEADDLLIKDSEFAVKLLKRHITVPLNQNQFDAFVSYIYNLGYGALYRKHNGKIQYRSATKFHRYLKKGDISKAIDSMNVVTSGGEVLKGLELRREAERKLARKRVEK